jgi:hypothetical protein
LERKRTQTDTRRRRNAIDAIHFNALISLIAINNAEMRKSASTHTQKKRSEE